MKLDLRELPRHAAEECDSRFQNTRGYPGAALLWAGRALGRRSEGEHIGVEWCNAQNRCGEEMHHDHGYPKVNAKTHPPVGEFEVALRCRQTATTESQACVRVPRTQAV